MMNNKARCAKDIVQVRPGHLTTKAGINTMTMTTGSFQGARDER
jgi:hypothetical protein